MDPAEIPPGRTPSEATEDAGANRDPEPSKMPPWIPRLILLIVVSFFLAYAAFSLLGKLRNVILWLIAALFLSFALEPAVNWLSKHGWRRGVATAVVLFGLALALVVLIAAMVPLLINQVKELIDKVPGWLREMSVYTDRWFGVKLTSTKITNAVANAAKDVGQVASNVASVGGFILGLVFQILTIGLFTFYLVADGSRFRRAVCSVLPQRRQREVLDAWEVAVDKTGGYLYSRLLLAIISAVFSFTVLTILGVPFALPLALFLGFVSQFIPVVGTYIAAAVPLLVALLQDPWSALIFLIYVVVYQQIENYLLAPRITAHTMSLHPAVAFFAALTGGTVAGVVGAFMALPAAAIIQATVSTYLTRHEVVESELTREPPQGGEDTADDRAPGLVGRLAARIRRPEGEGMAGAEEGDPESDRSGHTAR